MPPILSSVQKEQFVSEGYVVVRNLIPQEIVSQTRNIIYQALEIDPADKETWKGKPNLLPNLTEETAPCRTTGVEQVAEELVGQHFLREVVDSPYRDTLGLEPRMRGYIPVLNYPVEGEPVFVPPTGYHIDGIHYVTPLPTKLFLVVFAYLTDVVDYGGATAVLPGSHRQVLRHWEETGDKGNTVPPKLDYAPPIPMAGNAGDVIFMHYLTVHSGSLNRANSIRVGMNTGIMPDPANPYQRRQGDPQSDWTPLDHSLYLG
jgi:hypothetical protein